MKADLPNQFPLDSKGNDKTNKAAGDAVSEAKRRSEHLERRFHEWLRAAAAETARWAVLEPKKASANVPRLSIEPGGTVFASGDMSKRDVYTVQLSSRLKGITAIRLEALPDDRLPNRGPGRVYYEGPFGDFYLSEIRLSAGGKNVPFKEATASNPKAKNAAATAIDGDPQTGWSINGGQGHEQSAVFRLATPLEGPGEITVEMVFERYYAAGLGRFRISATDDPRALTARAIPFELEPILLIPEGERKPEQVDRLRAYYLSVAPELAKAREAIAKLESEIPEDPITLVMAERPPDNPRPTFVHNRGEYLQPNDRVQPAVLSMLPRDGAGASAQPVRPGTLAGLGVEPAHGARHDELPVGGFFRQGDRADGRRFRLPGRAPVAPRATRLPRHFAGRTGMVNQRDAPGHRHELDLPAVFAGNARVAGEGP